MFKLVVTLILFQFPVYVYACNNLIAKHADFIYDNYIKGKSISNSNKSILVNSLNNLMNLSPDCKNRINAYINQITSQLDSEISIVVRMKESANLIMDENEHNKKTMAVARDIINSDILKKNDVYMSFIDELSSKQYKIENKGDYIETTILEKTSDTINK